jgi:hypothetical protein
MIPSFVARLSEAVGEQIDPTALAKLQDTDSLLEVSRSGYPRSRTADGIVYQRYFYRKMPDPHHTLFNLPQGSSMLPLQRR